jgi:hypothetical protein
MDLEMNHRPEQPGQKLFFLNIPLFQKKICNGIFASFDTVIGFFQQLGIGITASCISVRYRSIPVPDWLRHRHFCAFRYQTELMPDSPTFRHLKNGYTLHLHTPGGRKGHDLRIQTAGRGWFIDFLKAPMILLCKKCIYCV